MTEPCWRCGGTWAPYCHGDPPGEQMPGQMDMLDMIDSEDAS